MLLTVNGRQQGAETLFVGSDEVLQVQISNDNGAEIDSTSDTNTLEFYTDKKRTTVVLSAPWVGTTNGLNAGIGTVTLTDVNTALFTAGKTYYAYAKRIVGGLIYFSENSVAVVAQ